MNWARTAHPQGDRSIPPLLKGLIFDVDGTLAETEETHRACFNAVFEQAALETLWDQQQYRKLLRITGGKERMRAYFKNSHYKLSDSTLAELHHAKNSCYAKHLQRSPPPLRAGVGRLIEEAKSAGLTLAIATTTSKSNLEALMCSHFGTLWRSEYAAVVCGENVHHKKPHPEAFLQALARSGLSADAAIAFEDSSPGVAAARAAGLAVIATPSLYFQGDDFSHASLTLDNLDQGIKAGSPPVGIAQLADWFNEYQNPHAEVK